MLRTAALNIVLLAVFGCVTDLPLRPPVDPAVAMNSGIVVVSVKMHFPTRYLMFGALDAERVFMYRIDGDAAPYTPGSIIWSDQVIGGNAVFLEVPPGRYAIAGAHVTLRSSSGTGMAPVGGGFSIGMSVTSVTPVTAYFADTLVRSLSAEVKGGDVITLGEVAVELGRMTALDNAQRYAYRRVAPDHVAGNASSWIGRQHYKATARRVDQSQARIDEISQYVREKLSTAGWQSMEPSGPSTLAALDYLVPRSTSTLRDWTGAPFPAVSLNVIDHVGSETSAADVANFEQVLAFAFVDAGFALGEEPADLGIDVAVSELTAGSHLFSLKDDPAVLEYTVTVHDPSGEILGRSGGERRLGDAMFTLEDPKTMGAAATTDLLFAQAAGDIVDYTQILHRVPAESIARWLGRPVIQIVSKDRVGTDDSAAASTALEERLAEELDKSGYRLGGGDDALTLEIEVVKYKPVIRTMRMAIGFGAGAARLAYKATVLDATGNLLGHTEGEKSSTGYEINPADNPLIKGDHAVRLDMLDHCARQISEYVQSLPIEGADQISVGP
jgi:hypothetical protein